MNSKWEDQWKKIRRLVGVISYKTNLCQIDLEYAGKEVVTGGKSSNSTCDYLTAEQRKSCLLIGLKGKDEKYKLHLYESKQLADTSNFDGKFGPTYAAYAIDKQGRMYIHEHVSFKNRQNNSNYFFHSSFLSGQIGCCFGMCVIKDGQIEYLDNRSGHYRPNHIHLRNAILRLFPYFSENAKIHFQREAIDKLDGNDSVQLGLDELFIQESDHYTIEEFLALDIFVDLNLSNEPTNRQG